MTILSPSKSTALQAAWGLPLTWQGDPASLLFDEENIQRTLHNLEQAVWVVETEGRIGIGGASTSPAACVPCHAAFAPALPPENLGDPTFKAAYRTRYALYAGSMANAISSVDMLINLGRQGLMGSYGAGGMSPERIEEAIREVKTALPQGPYAFNLINSPNEIRMEQQAAALYLQHGIRVIEASAYLALTSALVWYRAAGLSTAPDGSILIGNRIIAKISRKEIARRFLEPAPPDMLAQLVSEGKISQLQANLAQQVPMADDITAEADSGGHTDNRPLVGLLPAIIRLRDEIQAQRVYAQTVRIGAGGGIATPSAALAAFMMGAAYVVTGSINQACVESGASAHTRGLLAQAEMTDVGMAPAGDMFEMGVKVQVLKRGTLFAMRAQKLYDLYSRYEQWEDIPQKEREKLENNVFKRSFADIWQECVTFFSRRDPRQVERGSANAKDKMALVFRWYLGLSSRWSNSGEKGREMDYQIWCGPAMGAFNDWVKDSYLAEVDQRHVADVNLQLLTGCAYLQRLRLLEAQGVTFSPAISRYFPAAPIISGK